MNETITYIGLDVHKKTISVAIADGDLSGEVRYYGQISNTTTALSKLAGKLSGKTIALHFCYEAGPCGYGIYRHLTGLGHDCVVVAPSLIPRKPGDRVKTDRRDSLSLAKLHRAGELTAVWVPGADHEAMRDLVRARAAAGRALRRSRQQLLSFLLRHDRVGNGNNWTVAHRRWLSTLKFGHPAHQIVLQDYIDAVEEAEGRRERLTGQIVELLPNWSMAPLVEALQAMRGIALIVAVTLVSEVGDLSRFEHPSQLMAYLGLVPSEDSSGERRRRGSITKAGNNEARRIMVEAAWGYRHKARISRDMLARLEALPKPVRDIGWKAQVRLCARYRRMQTAGKLKQVITTAIAREMLGFAWAIAQEVKPRIKA